MKKIISKIAFALTVFALAFIFLGHASFRVSAQEVKAERTLRVADANYKLVTSKSQLVVGRKVIIAANNANYAVSATQGTSYRMAEAITKSGSYAVPTSSVGLFTLTNGTKSGTYGFYDDAYGYLYSTSNGTLKADSVHDGYSSFTLTISSNGNVTAKVYSKSLYLKYYSGSVAFACSTSKSNVFLYQAEDASTQPSTVAVTGVSLNTTSATLEVGKSTTLTATVLPTNATNKNVTWSSSNTSVATVSNGTVTAKAAGTATITVTTQDGSYKATATVKVTQPSSTTVAVTGVSLNTTSATLEVGKTTTLTATISPSNATNKNVTWSSSNTSVATVSNGTVTAKAAGTAKITVTTSDGNKTASATITVTEASTQPSNKAAWTIMIYICGADLESQNSLATSDLKEILSVSNQPNDVNILIQTGGASKWSTTYGINKNYLQRYHVANKKLVLDSNVSKANMGLTSTFESFLEWGLTSYPADKTGVIMWNHGGAMRGVCYDENYSDDSLLNSEVSSALSQAFTKTGRTEKLEFIGYDACLMNVQDVAEFNSHYFNYMIASEESESGYGWDYDTWVDDLYAKKSTTTILKAIVDGFIADNGGVSSSSNDQTLSYLNLSKMAAYKTAWENMAAQLKNKLTSSNKSSFISLVKNCKHYGDSYYTYYGIFDAKDFLNKLSSNSTFNPGSTYTSAALTAFNNLVEYSSCGKGAGNSNGMCMFYSVASTCYKSTYYSSTETNFSTWRSLVSTYGA